MSDDHRLKRLKIRSWRRGTKEMDIILGTFADQHAKALNASELDALEALMDENDIEIYRWVSGESPPDQHAKIIKMIRKSLD